MGQVRIVLLIQVLNSFVTGVLSIALPLMMDARKIDIITIGYVFAAMPIVFQLGRMIFAITSDFLGRKPFFLLSGCFGVVSNLIYYLAYTPLEFLFGKATEGVKSGSLWAVNRAFLLERSEGKWKALVNLRTLAYIASAAGSLLTGFFVINLFFEGTLMLCLLLLGLTIPLSLLLANEKKQRVNMLKALHFLDFRKKKKVFKLNVFLFLVMGLSFGFISGFVYPLFLQSSGFNTEMIGLLLGVQILLAGFISHLLRDRFEMKKLILFSGVLYTCLLIITGLTTTLHLTINTTLIVTGIVVVAYGLIEGLLAIGQEGILSRITQKESYGTDIGLLWMGHHVGRTTSLAATGLVISMFGFVAPFMISALIFPLFYIPSSHIIEE